MRKDRWWKLCMTNLKWWGESRGSLDPELWGRQRRKYIASLWGGDNWSYWQIDWVSFLNSIRIVDWNRRDWFQSRYGNPYHGSAADGVAHGVCYRKTERDKGSGRCFVDYSRNGSTGDYLKWAKMSKTHVAVWLRISPFYDMLLHISNCSEPTSKMLQSVSST